MNRKRNRLTFAVLNNTPLLLFAAVFIIFGLVAPQSLRYQSLENTFKQASYVGIVAVGMTFVLLTGGIDLSVGSNMYVSAVVAGLAMQRWSIGPWPALVLCLSVGALFGAVNAFAVTKLKIMPFIVTLAMMVTGRGVGLAFSKSRAVNFPDSVTGLGSAELLGLVPYPIVIFAAVVFCAWLLLERTTLGRQVYAAGYDKEAARKAGVDADKALISAYVLCGVFASLGGFISVAQLGNVNAGFGKGDEFDAIAAAVLGGVSLFGGIGRVFPGVVLGALFIQAVSNSLVSARVDLYLHPLIGAAFIFLAVFIDSLRNAFLAKLSRRNIRVEE
jgi:ribose/xylose/arabinose/galactoside ABC-type transport system permease subunit